MLEVIEGALHEDPQIKRITASARESIGFIMIVFDIETDANIKLLEVKNRVEAVLNDLPS